MFQTLRQELLLLQVQQPQIATRYLVRIALKKRISGELDEFAFKLSTRKDAIALVDRIGREIIPRYPEFAINASIEKCADEQ